MNMKLITKRNNSYQKNRVNGRNAVWRRSTEATDLLFVYKIEKK